MTRKINVFFAMLIVAALLLTACGGAAQPAADAGGEEMAEESMAEEEAAPEPAAQAGESILERVKARGTLVCGGRTDLAGFGYLDPDGNNIGFDIDLCRAVAAAVLGDPNAVEVVPLSAADRGPALQTAEVDLLSRNMTWTASRESQWGNFTLVMFYDGQGFMTRVDSGIAGPEDFDGTTVCVTSGTTTEKNLASYFGANGWSYEPVVFEDTASVYNNYEEGRCDLATSDKSQLAAVRSGFENPDDHVILEGVTISKEPLTPAVPHGDDAWFDVVTIVMASLINAEELGVTQANVEDMKSSEDPNVLSLLGQGDDWGYSQLGLEAESLANAIAAVGNYGEIYDRYMGPEGDAFTLPRGLNELWSNGGVIYAFPIK
jgi:general L-amino acid transport system substrate-binding protein